jgi:hypothetical protein
VNPIERWAGRLLRVVSYVVTVASGVYMLLYLVRWEWNRAMIAGLFFVAAEVALATSAVLRRLRRLERDLADLDVEETPRPASGMPAARPFAWLEEAANGHGVFIPVLLGLGVVASAIAWLIERLAATTWSLGGDASAARRLGWLATTKGGLRAADHANATGREAVRIRSLRDPVGPARASRVLAPLLVLALLAAVVVILARFTMYVPGPPVEAGRTSYELQVRLRSGEAPEEELVETLWRTCRAHIPGRAADITSLGGGRYELTVEPALGRNDDLRFSGCLGDLRFDFVVTDVLSREGVVALAPTRTAPWPS